MALRRSRVAAPKRARQGKAGSANEKDDILGNGHRPIGAQDVKTLAKRFFHRSFVGRTVGRIEQKAAICRFLDGPFGQEGLYIAGHPGTGKTAVVSELLLGRNPAEYLMLNCIMCGSAKTVLGSILKHFKVKKIGQLKNVCVILDEIDFLAERDMSLVNEVYSKYDTIKVIGIANTLDLAVTRLAAMATPLSFPPYSVQDIIAIITSRLEFANQQLGASMKLLDPLAIELCARKVATSGDLRKALELIQLAIDDAPVGSPGTPLITLSGLLRTIEQVYPSPLSSTASRASRLLEQCNVHQKVILIALLALRHAKLEARPSLAMALDEYGRMVKLGRLGDGLGRSDFLDAVANLEALGLTRSGAAGKGSGSHNNANNAGNNRWAQRVSVEQDPGELASAIGASNPLLAALLQA